MFNFAFIGCGLMANWHAQELLRSGHVRAVAAVDPLLSHADQFRHKYAPEAAVFPTVEALLADPTAYAISKGLPVASGATVQLDRSQPTGPFRQQEIVADWTADPASPVLHVPATPLVDFDELTDAELETVGAGNNVIIIIAAA